MTRFYSIPDLAPQGGEGQMNGGSRLPSREQLQQRYPGYYKNIDKPLDAPFAKVGDEYKIDGDNARVLNVEKNADGSQDMYVQRSVHGDSGTYNVKVEQGENRKQVITRTKRTMD